MKHRRIASVLVACLGCGGRATRAPSSDASTRAVQDAAFSVDAPPVSSGAPEAGSPDHGLPIVADAAAPDTATGPPPADAGAAACASLVCEDFESGQIDPGKWSVETSGGHTVMVQQAKVAHGKFAAQFHAPAGATGYDFIITKSGPAELRVHHFGRAYVLVSPKLPVGHTGLMFAGSSGFPRLKYLEVAGIRGGWQLSFVQLAGAATGETDFHIGCPGNGRCVPSIQMPTGVWLCVEWELDDQPDQIDLTVNGKPIATASPIVFDGHMTGLVGGFTDFGFGFYDWHPDDFAFDVYYDDLALDTKPIGCL